MCVTWCLLVSHVKYSFLEHVIRCFCWLLAWQNFFWHVRHVKCFSPMCVSWCFLKLSAWLNFFKQVSHSKDFLPFCLHWCLLKLSALLNLFNQVSQVKLFSPVCHLISSYFTIFTEFPQTCFTCEWFHLMSSLITSLRLDWFFSDKFHMWKISHQCVSLDVFLLPM